MSESQKGLEKGWESFELWSLVLGTLGTTLNERYERRPHCFLKFGGF